MNDVELYNSLVLQKIQIEDVSIGLRQIGSGDNLVFIHGFPTHGFTWRKIIPALSKKFRCHILDLPGLGDSAWTDETDFKSSAQGRYIEQLLAQKNIHKYSLIAHNSGATVARSIALNQTEKVENLIILNTEIPQHRPPWIPFYQMVGLWPGVPSMIRVLFKHKWFIKSSMVFKELYSDKSFLDDEMNIAPYINPILHSKEKTIGAFKYLKGIDWQLIDEFKGLHRKIEANVLFLWGEDDKTFPIKLGEKMVKQFAGKCEFVCIENASLLPHEEKPDEVLRAILAFV